MKDWRQLVNLLGQRRVGNHVNSCLDDFSMGSTSLKYLQSTSFDVVKLDGKLVRGMEPYKKRAPGLILSNRGSAAGSYF